MLAIDRLVFCKGFANKSSKGQGPAVADTGARDRIRHSEKVSLRVSYGKKTWDWGVILGAYLRVLIDMQAKRNCECNGWYGLSVVGRSVYACQEASRYAEIDIGTRSA